MTDLSSAREPARTALDVARQHVHQGRLRNSIPWFLWSDPRDTVVSLDLRVATGSASEVEGHTGLAHMLEHLMFRGTPSVPDGAFDAAMEGLGATINAFTWLDYTAYVSTFPAASLQGVLHLEADRFQNLRVVPDIFTPERDVVANERRQTVEADPVEVLHEQFHAQTLDGSPYAHPTIGWREDIAAYTTERVQAFFDAHYHSGNLAIVACGPLTPESFADALEATFGKLPQAAPRPRPRITRSFHEANRQVHMPLSAQRLLLAWPAPGRQELRQWATWALMHELLAGSEGARITNRLEVEDRIALECDASLDPHRGPGLYRLIVTLRDGVGHRRALNAINAVLETLATDGPTIEEVRAARLRMATRDAGSLASTASRADWMADSWVTFHDPLTGFGVVDAVERVRRRDLQRLAHEMRHELPRSMTWARIGDEA